MPSLPWVRPFPRLTPLVFILWFFCFPPSARADGPFLNDNGQPNALFWATGAATVAADKPLYDAVQRLDSPGTHRAAVFFNHFGDGRVQLGLFALLYLVGNGTDETIARRGLHGLVAGGLIVYALKETTRKSRPYTGRGPNWASGRSGAKETALAEPRLADHPDSNSSFPSGHTMAAFSLASVWANERSRDRELAYALAALVGMSRISLKQHWPSDVFFGAAIGMAAGSAANRGVPFGLMFRVK